ncbi:arsenic resistance N-acetyltransferase ArsN2 [Pseudomonas turukhanskensis]|uniref:N-acetyltransferase domain-containing protein n=1 Tax=Pseudomonas turukhanskensis TaxID=1806536 RepID=A0A9W6K786_9PSED|nr:arsenic resistance N-acetyltransferase ArsN2 [Pseudomonas turukhanskensis]GLK90766.1 hypothetical protein GCM10017655_38300 [Pseudomonas turukhanskensis]
MTIQAIPVDHGQWPRFRDALKSTNLPLDDIELPGRTFFEFQRDGQTVGWGGFENYGADGLLLSLVVETAHRSKGMGVATLQLIEVIAAEQGITRLHLLPTTASGFFERFGYEVRERGSEPKLISQTEQFKGLCLGSARYMSKVLSAKITPELTP